MENVNNHTLEKPSNHLGYVIFAYLFFWPLGIPALVHGVRVNKLWYAGDHKGAIASSEAVKRWANLAKIVGIVFWIVYGILYTLLIIADAVLQTLAEQSNIWY